MFPTQKLKNLSEHFLLKVLSICHFRTLFIEKVKVIHAHKPYSLYIYNLIPPLILSAIRGLFGIRMTRKIRKYKWEYFKSKGIKL